MTTTLPVDSPSTAIQTSTGARAAEDSEGAQLRLERKGTVVGVRALFVNGGTWRGTLTYELDVQRNGRSGAARASESGTFTVSPGHSETLSTIEVSVADEDVVIAQLVVWQGDDPVNEVCLWREIEL